MSKQLASLRDVAEDLKAGECELRTEVEMRVGNAMTRWDLVIGTEWHLYDGQGRLMYQLHLYHADIPVGPPDGYVASMFGVGPRVVHTIMQVFGVDPEARVWAMSAT